MTGVTIVIFLVGAALFQLKTTAANFDVRLVGDSTPPFSYGRVEVLINGTWGTFCSSFFQWSLQDAHVICRQLGFDGAVTASSSDAFGVGTGSQWANDLQCVGTETSISECKHNKWMSVRSCGFGQAQRANSAMCKQQVRLIGGTSPNGGLVQVYYNRTWLWVCGEQWDKQDADVVCRWLGYSNSSEVYINTTHVGDNNTTWINNVQCTGNEDSLFSCVHGRWRNNSCANNRTAGVVCSGSEVRLISSVHDVYRGRVEVLYNGAWGRICEDEDWSIRESDVVCRQLGYDGALLNAYIGGRFDVDVGVIGFTSVRCIGNENSISNCRGRQWRVVQSCGYGYDSGVMCNPPVRLIQGLSTGEGLVQAYLNNTWVWVCDQHWDKQDADVVCRELGFTGTSVLFSGVAHVQENDTTWINTVQCTGNESSFAFCAHDVWTNGSCQNAGVVCNGSEVRLTRRNQFSWQPEVQVLFKGFWGPVCSAFWDLQDANVVCHQLGHDGALAAPVHHVPQGDISTEVICLGLMECIGNESSVLHCAHDEWKVSSEERETTFGTGQSIAICAPKVRIVGAPASPPEGVVQMFYNNAWGWLCDEQWDKPNADVVCRELGLTNSSAAQIVAASNQEHGTIWTNNVQCLGNESSLFACPHDGWKLNGSCGNNQRAGLVCSGSDVRLVSGYDGSVTSQRGIVEVLFGAVWGRVCSDSWDLNDSHVICRHLGYDEAQSDFDPEAFGDFDEETELTWISNVQCGGRESFLSECRFEGWDGTFCGSFNPASVICKPPGSPGKPFFITNTVDSITIGWNSQSLKNLTYSVEIKQESSWVDASCRPDSLLPNLCTVRGFVALVTGLKQNTMYRFRVNAIYKDIKSAFSQPSDLFRTAGDAGTSDYLSCTVKTNLLFSTLFARMFTILPATFITFHEPCNL